jgi:hypothetical protein
MLRDALLTELVSFVFFSPCRPQTNKRKLEKLRDGVPHEDIIDCNSSTQEVKLSVQELLFGSSLQCRHLIERLKLPFTVPLSDMTS